MNAEAFNSLHPVGTLVFAYPGARPEGDSNAERVVTRTRTKAELFRGRRDVVWVEDLGAYVLLTHVDVVPEAEWEAAKLADAVAAEGMPMPVGPARLTSEREAETRKHVTGTENFSLGNLAARDLLAELAAVRAELAARTEDVAFMERATLPELRRTVEHHKDGKQRWRDRAERAETERDALQKRLHEAALTKVWVNEDGKRFVFLEDIAPVLLGVEPKPEATS